MKTFQISDFLKMISLQAYFHFIYRTGRQNEKKKGWKGHLHKQTLCSQIKMCIHTEKNVNKVKKKTKEEDFV